MSQKNKKDKKKKIKIKTEIQMKVELKESELMDKLKSAYKGDIKQLSQKIALVKSYIRALKSFLIRENQLKKLNIL